MGAGPRKTGNRATKRCAGRRDDERQMDASWGCRKHRRGDTLLLSRRRWRALPPSTETHSIDGNHGRCSHLLHEDLGEACPECCPPPGPSLTTAGRVWCSHLGGRARGREGGEQSLPLSTTIGPCFRLVSHTSQGGARAYTELTALRASSSRSLRLLLASSLSVSHRRTRPALPRAGASHLNTSSPSLCAWQQRKTHVLLLQALQG